MKPNAPLLRKVQEAILAKPSQFKMTTFFSNPKGSGVAGCIGGYAIAISRGHSLRAAKKLGVRKKTDFWEEATQVLRLTPLQAKRLFSTYCWPERFREPFGVANSDIEAAQLAAARIDCFLQTGE